MNFSAGFDFSWNEASFAVVDSEGKTLSEKRLPLSGRDASSLPAWMRGILRELGLDFNSVSAWTVGSGPGSFTGMRIAAALVLGLTFGRDSVKRRSMPTASAMAFSLSKSESFEKAVALFDGRKSDILAFETLRKPDGSIVAVGQGRVLQDVKQDLLPEGAALLALSKDAPAIEKFFGRKLASSVRYAEHVDASSLVLNAPDDYSAKLSDLVYIRPPVFVEPKAPRAL